jgi:chlorobactene glucosyltransferase
MANEHYFLAATAILFFYAGFWLLRLADLVRTLMALPEIPLGRSALPDGNLPLISVVVPAHNEEAVIAGCLESVLRQDYPYFELIIVDDRSQDRTSPIARSLGDGNDAVKVISVNDLPEGWTGKCHALSIGVRYARGEWLAFLDADSRIHPCTLRECYWEALRNKVSMVTLTPGLVLKGFWEKALQPVFFGMYGTVYPLGSVNDPKSKVASANGMFYLISRRAYDLIGGHHCVKGLAVEDIGIGKRVKAAGLGLLFVNGRKLLQTRMYTTLGEIVEGWARILAASMNYRLPTVVRHLITHSIISLPIMAAAYWCYAAGAPAFWPWALLPLVGVMEVSLASFLFYPLLGVPRRYSVLAILGDMTLVAVLGLILKRILHRDALSWRGTTYPFSRHQPAPLEPLSSGRSEIRGTTPSSGEVLNEPLF